MFNTFYQLLERQAKLTPKSTAIVYYEQSLTYQELNEQSNQFARYLQNIGIKKNEPVGLYVDRSLELPIILMGVLKCGAVCVPIDVDVKPEKVNFIIDDNSLSHIIIHSIKISQFLKQTAIQFIHYEKSRLSSYSVEDLNLPIKSNDLAYILYTSGSTGHPKGVELEHEGLVNTCMEMAKMVPNSVCPIRLLQFSSISFDALIPEIGIPISKGGTLIITKKIDQLPGGPIVDVINKHKINVVILLPSILRTIQDANFTHLKVVMSAGEMLSPYIANKLKKDFVLVNAYGPTEASVDTTLYRVNKKKKYTNTIPIGKPIKNVEIQVLDQDLKSVSSQEIGELYIGGIGLARGYRDPEQTAKSFITVAGKRLYKTGDFVRILEDGDIEYIGRKDRQIKYHGIRIHLDEIERVLSEHDSIAAAATIFIDNILFIYITLKPNRTLNEIDLRTYLRNKLPSGVAPNKCFFLPNMPLNLNGKIDYQLLAQYQGSFVTGVFSNYAWSEDERTLGDILQDAIQINQIEPDTDFFDMGMDSFSAVNLANKVSEVFNLDIRVSKFYEYSSIRKLAGYIQKLKAKQIEIITDFNNEVRINEILTKRHYIYNTENIIPKNILLTGATGFLGIFLLEELLKYTDAVIYCLVRAKDSIHALQRLRDAANKYKINIEQYLSRIQPISGDIAQPLLGLKQNQFTSLSKIINRIYHVASDVSFIKPYAALKSTNVIGTEEILRFAVYTQIIPIHYVSTLSVFSCRHYFEKGFTEINEDTDTTKSAPYLPYEIGYVQSKWVADQLMQQAIKRGVPVAIYRPGLILCHSKTGVLAPQQFWHGYVSECLRLGIYANLVDQLEEFISVDYAAKAILALSQRSDTTGKIYHLCPSEAENISSTAFIKEMSQLLNCKLKSLPYTEWLKQVINDLPENKRDNYLYSFFPLLCEKVYNNLSALELYQHTPKFLNIFTYDLLAATGILPTSIDKLIEIYSKSLPETESL